jgi:hypothetical protein
MIWFKRQIHNPNKHSEMPELYPWEVQTTQPENLENWDSVETQEEFDSLINSFDLTAYNAALNSEDSSQRQERGREFGESIIKEFIDAMGTRNLDLSKAGSTVNILAVAQDNASIKLLIETGALKTARDMTLLLKQKYPSHVDLYDWAYNILNNFLTESGYL